MLAIVDTHFPQLLCGFKYWENYEFYKIDKSILFFSLHKMNDYFPAKVYPLSSIKEYPITDIYCVFLNHTLRLLDYPGKIPDEPGKQNYGLSKFIQDKNISIHTTIYAGGGYEENFPDQVVKGLLFLRGHPNVKSVFTQLSSVQKIIPWAHRTEDITNTDFYRYRPRVKSNKLHIVFAARPVKEKGFNYLIKAFNKLDPSRYHLHIVGDWRCELRKIKHHNYTFMELYHQIN